jgi:hypothetical protein
MAGWPTIRGGWCGAITGVGGRLGMKRLGAVGVMGGTLLGTLFRIHHPCVLYVNFKERFWVGFGAFMMGGVLVIRWNVWTLVSTLCFTL